MLFTRLVTSLKNWVAPVAILGAGLFTMGLAPKVYDTHVLDVDGMEDVVYVDTTYDDGRFVILKTVTCVAGLCSFEGPDPNDFSVRYKYDWTQSLVFTWETGFGDAVDSASVDSIWEAWGYDNPQAYALAVPGEPPFYAGIDTVGALWHANFSDYLTTEDFLGDWSTWNGGRSSSDQYHLDTNVSYPGLTNSARIDYTYLDSASFCYAQRPVIEVYLPDYATGNYRDVWFEFGVLTDSGSIGGPPSWIDCADPSIGGPGNGFAWKVQQIFTTKGTGYGRWQVVAGDCGSTITEGACWKSDGPLAWFGGPGYGLVSDIMVPWDVTVNPTSKWNDNTWHKMRYYVRMGPSNDSTVYDGSFQAWQDSTLVLPVGDDPDSLHRSPTDVYVKGFALGQNKDKGGWYADQGTVTYPRVEHTWIGYVTVWVAPDTPAWYSEVPLPSYLP